MQRFIKTLGLLCVGFLVSPISHAGSQIEEPLSHAVKAMMQRSISDKAPVKMVFATPEEGVGMAV